VEPWELAVFVWCWLSVSAWLTIRHWRDQHRKMRRAMLSAPRSTARSARHWEVVRIVGNLRLSGVPVRAKQSGRACAYACEKKPGQTALGFWIKRVFEEQRSDFVVDDGTGEALVRIERATVVAVRKEISIGFARWEAVLEAGATIAVMGLARREEERASGAPPYRGEESERPLYFAATDDVPLVITDDPGSCA
jgi:hypothetical protein